mgnify:CR=1 FL=1
MDTADLRRIRRNLQNALAGGNLDALVAARAGDLVEILSGVDEGEEVVTRANFLVDSESRLKASLQTLGGATP